jgi:hypothetical protein
MQAGLCFCCKEHGHLLRDCPKKGKGRDLTWISELEAELQLLKAGTGKLGESGKGEGSKNGPDQD